MNEYKNESHDLPIQTKAVYTKPTLIEYGSLAERTRMFGLNPLECEGDDDRCSITSVTF